MSNKNTLLFAVLILVVGIGMFCVMNNDLLMGFMREVPGRATPEATPRENQGDSVGFVCPETVVSVFDFILGEEILSGAGEAPITAFKISTPMDEGATVEKMRFSLGGDVLDSISIMKSGDYRLYVGDVANFDNPGFEYGNLLDTAFLDSNNKLSFGFDSVELAEASAMAFVVTYEFGDFYGVHHLSTALDAVEGKMLKSGKKWSLGLCGFGPVSDLEETMIGEAVCPTFSLAASSPSGYLEVGSKQDVAIFDIVVPQIEDILVSKMTFSCEVDGMASAAYSGSLYVYNEDDYYIGDSDCSGDVTVYSDGVYVDEGGSEPLYVKLDVLSGYIGNVKLSLLDAEGYGVETADKWILSECNEDPVVEGNSLYVKVE